MAEPTIAQSLRTSVDAGHTLPPVAKALIPLIRFNGSQLIQGQQKRAASKSNGHRFEWMQSHHLANLSGIDKIGRPEHRHWICRFEVRELLLQFQLIADGYRHQIWAEPALSSRMVRVDCWM